MEVINTVLIQGAAIFNMCGQFMGYPLTLDPDQKISHGLVNRLIKYAHTRLVENGLASVVAGWTVEVSTTTDGYQNPADRYYSVGFTNKEGTEIVLTGIMTRKGWPFLDYGWKINT